MILCIENWVFTDNLYVKSRQISRCNPRQPFAPLKYRFGLGDDFGRIGQQVLQFFRERVEPHGRARRRCANR